MGLGRFENVTLEEARRKASCLYQKIKDDPAYDPIADRHHEQVTARLEQNTTRTFSQCTEEFIALKKCEWSNPKHAQQWENTLKTYAFPVIGSLPLKSITTEHVKQLLKPIWHKKTETATRVRNRIDKVLNYSLANKIP